jgi:hypothetical protein
MGVFNYASPIKSFFSKQELPHYANYEAFSPMKQADSFFQPNFGKSLSFNMVGQSFTSLSNLGNHCNFINEEFQLPDNMS